MAHQLQRRGQLRRGAEHAIGVHRLRLEYKV
jgi:hypothetical protein